MWFWAFTLCLALESGNEFCVPQHSIDNPVQDAQEIYATDAECIKALIRVAHLYEIVGMTIRGDRCNPVHWDMTLNKQWR